MEEWSQVVNMQKAEAAVDTSTHTEDICHSSKESFAVSPILTWEGSGVS